MGSARIVSTEFSAGQVSSIARPTGHIKVKVRSFADRVAALRWLKSEAD